MAVMVSNGKTVLITGINGYIASVLGLHLLKKGYSLRGTARSAASSERLLQGPYAPYAERVKIYEVPDITVSGAFDEASKGVHGIFHTASPIDFTLDTYEKMVVPAVKGTETILESALKSGSQLSSVVVTSSVAAIRDPSNDPNHVFDETDFASLALERALKDREEGAKSSSTVLYVASKIAAERAVWKFRDEHKPAFAISTINPGVVVGPPIILPKSGAQLNETLKPIFDVISGSLTTVPPEIGSGSFVDVRDVAFIHTWAYEHPEIADGERYLAAEGFGPQQGTADILRYKYKGTKIAENIPVGQPGGNYVGYDKETGEVGRIDWLPGVQIVSGKKAQTVMGFKYIEYRQSIEEAAEVLEALL